MQEENNFGAAMNGREAAAAVSNESSSGIDLDVEGVLTYHRTPVCHHFFLHFAVFVSSQTVLLLNSTLFLRLTGLCNCIVSFEALMLTCQKINQSIKQTHNHSNLLAPPKLSFLRRLILVVPRPTRTVHR